jgi:hypothetical protein
MAGQPKRMSAVEQIHRKHLRGKPYCLLFEDLEIWRN